MNKLSALVEVRDDDLLDSQKREGLVKGKSLIKGLEQEIELKAQLFADGIQIDDEALKGIPDIYAGCPAITPHSHRQKPIQPDAWWPSNLILPLGTKYKCYGNYNSPFIIKRDKDTLFIENNGKFISTCEWEKRAADFEDTILSDGKTRAGEIATLLCSCFFVIQKQAICNNWLNNESCRYCDIYHPEKIGKFLEIIARTRAPSVSMGGTPDQIAEASEIAKNLGYHIHQMFLGGLSSDWSCFFPYIEAIKNNPSEGAYLRGAIETGAPANLSDIDKVYEMGITGINMDIECWHPSMFDYICPGKSRTVGYDNWLKALEYAGKKFRPGNTTSSLVVGLESKQDYLEAAKWMGDRGILLMPSAFQPFWGTALEGHRPPTWEWLLDVSCAIQDIMDKCLPTKSDEFWNSAIRNCYSCNIYALGWDLVRLRRDGTIATDRKGRNIKLGDDGWEFIEIETPPPGR